MSTTALADPGVSAPIAAETPSQHNGGTEDFAEAMRVYEDGHFQEAFVYLSKLADLGHPDAARMAFQIWRFGPEVLNQQFSASEHQRQAWLATWFQGRNRANSSKTFAAIPALP